MDRSEFMISAIFWPFQREVLALSFLCFVLFPYFRAQNVSFEQKYLPRAWWRNAFSPASHTGVRTEYAALAFKAAMLVYTCDRGEKSAFVKKEIVRLDGVSEDLEIVGEQASFKGNGSQALPVVPYNVFQGDKSKTRVSTFKQGEWSAGLKRTTRARLN